MTAGRRDRTISFFQESVNLTAQESPLPLKRKTNEKAVTNSQPLSIKNSNGKSKKRDNFQ